MRDYKKMADILTPVKVNDVSVDVFEIKESSFSSMMSGIGPGRYARLRINGECMMSETPMEQRTNRNFICDAYGDVLIGGLGIGMIILAIQDEPEIKSITVIESNKNVIDAILPQLPINDKVQVINSDVFTYKPKQKFDCIYMDIWAYVNRDVYKEMVKLKRRYGHYLKSAEESPKRFNKCWAEWYAKNERRLY